MSRYLEEVTSADGRQRARILRTDEGLYVVLYEALMEDHIPEVDFRTEYWGPFMSPSLTDTWLNARKLAQDAIRPRDTD